MNESQTLNIKAKDITRIQSNAQLANQIHSEEIHIYSKRSKALHFNPAMDTAVPRRDPFAGTKSFVSKNDSTISDISDISFPTRKESGITNDSIGDQSQRINLMSSESKPVGKATPQIASKLSTATKLVGQKLFIGVSLSLMTLAIGSIVSTVVLMQNISQLESRTRKLEKLVLNNENGDAYNDALIQARLSANINKTDTLENVTIPGIQSNLSANIDATNNIENIVIPGIRADLAANVAITDNLGDVVIPSIESSLNNVEDVVIPGIQSNISANVDQIKNLEDVVIPGIQSNISANDASISNLENVVIPGLQSDISSNTAQINSLSNVIIPGIQNNVSSNTVSINNLANVVIPGIQNSISSNTAQINNLANVIIPGIQTNVSSNTASINNLANVVIPGLQNSISSNTASINNLANTVIPSIQSSLSANVAQTNNLVNTVIPGIQSNVTTIFAEIAALQALIKAVPKFYYGITPTSAWTAYTAYGIVQTVDISRYGFVNPPIVITSLGGVTSHWVTVGASSVYGITKSQFTVYIRWADGDNTKNLAPSDAVSMGWQLQYVVFSTDS